jgi:hypothetical protein
MLRRVIPMLESIHALYSYKIVMLPNGPANNLAVSIASFLLLKFAISCGLLFIILASRQAPLVL